MINQTVKIVAALGNLLHPTFSSPQAAPLNESCDLCQELYDSEVDANLSASVDIVNGTFSQAYAPWQITVLGFMAGLTSLVTIFGNLIVILSFIVERTIRQPTNYFIASLAVSDLLIGSISMPFYTVYLLAGHLWPLGELLCDLWLSLDYTVCLCSIYTVFCITIDRFCSVKIPAKYRNWRTEQKVLVMIALTWAIPILMFFTSIIGWQYFVGERTVLPGMCYVQYMDSAVFNSLLQLGYFWTTLFVMCALMFGIYRVALNLQRKSEAKHRKMATLVSVAGREIGKIGVGMSQTQNQQHQQHQRLTGDKATQQQQQLNNQLQNDTKRITPQTARQLTSNSLLSSGGPITSSHAGGSPTCRALTSSASCSSSRTNDRDDDRSSSVELPSDNDRSSQMSLKLARPGSVKSKPNQEQHRPSVRVNETKLKMKRKSLFGSSMISKLQAPSPAGRLRRLSQAFIAGFSSGSGTIADQTVAAAEDGEASTATATPTLQSGHNVAPEVCNSSPEKDTNDYRTEHEQAASGRSAHIYQAIDCCDETRREDYGDEEASSLKQEVGEDAKLRTDPLDDDTQLVFDDYDDILRQEDLVVRVVDCPVTCTSEINGDQQFSPVWKRLSHEFFSDEVRGKEMYLETSSFTKPACNGRRSTIPGTITLSIERSRRVREQRKMEPGSPPSASCIGVSRAEITSDDTPNDAFPIQTDKSVPSQNVLASDVFYTSPPPLPQPPPPLTPPIPPPPQPLSLSQQNLANPPPYVDTDKQPDHHHDDEVVNEVQPRPAENNGHPLTTPNINNNEGGGIATTMTTTLVAPRSTSTKWQHSNRHSKRSIRRNRANAGRSGGSQPSGKGIVAVSKSENRARKAFRMITILLGAFVLCWTPWHVLSLIIGFCPDTCAENTAVKVIYDISYWLCYLNSPINPFCYAFANQQFKKTFLRIIKFDWHRT